MFALQDSDQDSSLQAIKLKLKLKIFSYRVIDSSRGERAQDLGTRMNGLDRRE
jgi:hypothetical protein